jgi:hypothetical protein
MNKSVELKAALEKLEKTRAEVAAVRAEVREAAVRRATGLKEVKALMRKLKVSVSDLTDPKFMFN